LAAPAFLLAAGLGTRLRPLTHDRPKPLVPLCGLPLLDQAVARLSDQGFEGAVVNAHHLPDAVEAWADAHDFPLQVSVEAPAILGTGGGLRHARALLADRFVVVNGDVLADVDLRGMIDRLDADTGTVMALRDGGPQYGIVAFDSRETVVDLVGLAEAEPVGAVDRTRHFTGIYALDQRVLEHVPPGEACIVRTAWTKLVPQRQVGAWRHDGIWVDLGNPQLYLEANRAALDGVLPLSLEPFTRAGFAERGDRTWGSRDAVAVHPSATLTGPVWLGPGATVRADARVGPGVVIGAGARVGAGARLRDTVVWDGAAVAPEARLEAAIVHDSGVLEGLDPTGRW
jgi:NDP-sugar pyrophosphorylase family protein